MSRSKAVAAGNGTSRATGWIAGVLLLSIATIATLQYWWKLPLESLGSPADILELLLGVVVSLACLLVGFRAEPGSWPGKALTGMAGLFLALSIVEYLADSGPIDIPLSFLWLTPVLLLALTPVVSRNIGPARLSFWICVIIQLAEVGRSLLVTIYYGGLGEPPVFGWIESASDLLLRAFLLLGFVEALHLGGLSGTSAGALANSNHAPLRRDDRRRHVAFFMYRLSGGGAQLRAVALANGLLARGYQVDFVVINDKVKQHGLLAPGLRLIALNAPRWGGVHAWLHRRIPYRTIRIYLGVVAFARYLLVARPGTIVAGSCRVLLSAVIAWQIAGRGMPLVLRATNFPSGNLNLWRPLHSVVDVFLGALLRLIYPVATATVAVADGVAEEVARLTGTPRQRIATVFEPVLDGSVAEMSRAPLDHPWLEEGQPPVLLAVGHLRPQKDFVTLIRAFALARAKRPLRLMVLGEGKERPRLEKMIKELGIADDVCLYGYCDNPFAWMSRVSMFVLSSAWEGLPAVLIEALACGCPIVSTNCPSGPWEILAGGRYGRLVPCRDPQSLAHAMLATLTMPVDHEALIERAQAFSADASVDGYIRVFDACHSNKGVGVPAAAAHGPQYRRGVLTAAMATSGVVPRLGRQSEAITIERPAPRHVPGPRSHSMPPADGLTIDRLAKSFGGRQVVGGASLSVRRGEAVGLLGPNGAGKTTVFYMITGLIAADQGTISLDGEDITTLPMYQRARLGIGYLSQESSIFRSLTVEDNIRAVLQIVEPDRKRREVELRELLDEFSILHLRHLPAVALSGGERRRLEIARSLATRPQFMLLDEPFAGIDPIAIDDIRQLVRQLTARGIGVLMTDHNVRETLELIDRALIIHEGAVLTEGTPQEIVNNPDVRQFYLGEDFAL